MKKITALLLALTLALLLAACGAPAAQEESIPADNVSEEATPAPTPAAEKEEVEETPAPEVSEEEVTTGYSSAALDMVASLGTTVENERIVILKHGSVEDMNIAWYRVYVYENGFNLREENYYFVTMDNIEKLLSTAEKWDENGGFTINEGMSLTIHEDEGWMVTTKEEPKHTWAGNPWLQDYEYIKSEPEIGTILE